MRPIIVGFGLMILCLLILFKIGEFNFQQNNVKLEIIVAIAAVIFFFIGIYFNHNSGRSKNKPTDQTFTTDHHKLKKAGLTNREHEVLLKMAEGLSNQEIASALFLSESTIKTHVSNILFKLDAKRRTQAIQEAKKLGIVP